MAPCVVAFEFREAGCGDCTQPQRLMLTIGVIDALCRKHERESKNHSSSYYPETNANILVFSSAFLKIWFITLSTWLSILFSFNITTL